MHQEVPLKRRRGRPPKSQSAYSETKAKLIRAGMEILTERGYSATGIDEILRSVGVPKGSFYYYFGSKKQFGLELIDSYSQFFKAKLNRFLLDESTSPLDRLLAFMDDAEQSMRRYQFKRGCLVGNLGQEMGMLPEEFRLRLMRVFEEWQRSVETCLEEAKSQGEISANSDCHQLAYVFWTGWEGAVLRAKLEGHGKPLGAFSQFFLARL